jgi:hypothetical protein
MNNWKDMEESRHGPIRVLFWHLPGGTKESHEKPLRIVGFPANI